MSMNKRATPVQLPRVPVNKRPQSALDEFWTQKGTSGAIDAFRQLSNHKRGRRKKPSLPGGKLQPLFKNHTAPANLDRLGAKHAVLPHIHGQRGSGERSISNTPAMDSSLDEELLAGSLDDIPPPKPSTVRVYLAALQPDLALEHAAIMKTSVPKIQEFCSSVGLHFHLVDLSWGMGARMKVHGREHREMEIAQCKEQSIGPHTVVLLGDSAGAGEPPPRISLDEYNLLHSALEEAGKTEAKAILLSAYQQIQDDTYILQLGSIVDEEQEQLMQAIRPIVQQATEQGNMSEERTKQFLHSALSWDVEQGVFSELHPRRHCLCYQREVTGLPDDHDTDPRILELRQRLAEQLGPNTNRPFYLKASDDGKPPAHDSEQYQTYLNALTDAFAADVIESVRQDLEQFALVRKSKVREDIRAEIVTHARIGLKRCRNFVGQRQILEKVERVLKDPKNNSPFVIYGGTGSGKTATIARIAQLIKEWFSSESVVIHRVLGATTQSSGIYNTVISLVQQVCLAYDLPQPDNSRAFCTLYTTLCTFRDVIERVSREKAFARPLFLLLDGIDHLQPYEESLRALWAITHLPPNVHVVTSTVPSTGKINFIGALQMFITEYTAELEPLTEEEARDLVKKISQSFSRDLPAAQIDKLIKDYSESAQPLTLVQFTLRALAEWNPTMAAEELKLPQNAKQQLNEKLDELEKRFGEDLVNLLTSYITCLSIGIHERDLQDLLSMNNDVMEEVHGLYGPSPDNVNQVPMGAISSIKYELRDYLEEHTAYGKPVLAWSNRDFYDLVAEKYQVIFPGMDEDGITEESTSFALMLHEYMAAMYLPDSVEETDNTKNMGSMTFPESVGEKKESLILTPQPLVPANVTKLMRVPVHMKVLLPIEGVERAKKCMVFNFKWLQTKLEAVPVYIVLQDLYNLIVLTQRLAEEDVFNEQSAASNDMEVLYECLQMSADALIRSPRALASQLYGRLGSIQNIPTITSLLEQVKAWLKENSDPILHPVYPCFAAPEGEIRHVLHGPTHVVTFLSKESVAVMFSQKTGCDVWRVSTGELLHRFPVNPEQVLRGVVPGHTGEFVIIGHYSHLNHKMELGVWSTETGIQILKSNFPYRFDVFVLSADDQVMIFSTTIEMQSQPEVPQFVIMGVNVETKDVIYNMPVYEVHSDGITQLITMDESINGVTNGLISIGNRTAKDLAFWDLDKQELVFSVGLGCFASLVKVHASQGIAVCASPESSNLVVVDLNQGKIRHSIQGSSLRDMNDILLTDDGSECLVATQSSGVVIYSMDTAAQVKSILLPTVDGVIAMPTKLLLEGKFVFAGQSNGNIQILAEESGELIHVLRSHNDAINSLRFNSKHQLFSASDDGTARVWNGEKILSECLQKIKDKETGAEETKDETPAGLDVITVLLMPDGKEVMTATSTGVKVWSVANGQYVRTLCEETGVVSLLLAYKGKLLLTSSQISVEEGGALLLKAWRQDTGAALPFSDTVDGGGIIVYCSTLFPSEDKLLVLSPAASTQDSGINVSIYELFSMTCVHSMHCNIYGNMDSSNLRFLGFSYATPPVPKPELILPGEATMVEIESTDLPPNRLHDKQRQQAANANPNDGKLYAVLDYFPNPNQSFFFTFVVSADDKVTMEAYEPMHINSVSPRCSVLLPEGGRCVTGTIDGAIAEWDVTRQEITRHLHDPSIGKHHHDRRQHRGSGRKARLAHEGSVSCVVVGGDVLVSGGMEGVVKVWSLSAGTLSRVLNVHSHMVSCLSLSGTTIAAGSVDDKLALVDLKSGKALSSFYAGQSVRSVDLAGKYVVLTVGEEDRPKRLILLSTDHSGM